MAASEAKDSRQCGSRRARHADAVFHRGTNNVAESCRRVLEIEIPPEVVKGRAENIASRLQRGARVAGFRPGKVPLSLVRQRFRGEIRAELLRELVPEYVQAQAKEHKWEPIGNPTVSDIEYAEDSPLKFKASMEVMPEVELEDWEDLHVEVEQPEVSEEEVEKALRHMQEEGATYINLEPRPLEDGDYASIEVKELSPNAEPSSEGTREYLFEIGGANTLKEFTENLRGADLGEERRFAVSYPPDLANPRLAGKTVSYQVKVLGLKRKQLPELNDDFAQSLGRDFKKVDDLKQVKGFKKMKDDKMKSMQDQLTVG